MSEDLKSLLKIGLTNSIQSFIPVLLWVLLGVVFDDSRYSNGYIITYPYQFVSSLLYHFIFKSQLKSEVKNKSDNHNAANTGIKLLFLVYTLVFVLSLIFKYDILQFLNVDTINDDVFIFGLSQMLMDWVLYGIVTTQQYDNRNMTAFTLVLFWYISKLVLTLVLGISNMNPRKCLMFTSLYMFILLVLMILKYCKQKKYLYSLGNSIKFSLYSLPNDIGMLVIYIFGISSMASNSEIVLSAYNMMSMCTDTQWDILDSAIDTVGALKVKTGEFIKSRKKLFRDTIIYSLLLFISSLALIGICWFIPTYRNSINFMMVLIMFMLECWGFPFYGIKYMMISWLSIEHPNGYSFIITTLTYIARFTVMYLSISDYNVSYGVVASCLVGNICHILVYLFYAKGDKVYD